MEAQQRRPNNFPIWEVCFCHGYDGIGPAVLICSHREDAEAFIRERGPGDFVIRRRRIALRKPQP